MARMLAHGSSLIELMISLALGAFLSIGLVALFLATKQSYRLQEASSRRLDNGRFALSMLQHDIRQSAYRGCARSIAIDTGVDITVNSTASTGFLYNFSRAIDGFEATGTNMWAPALDASITNVVSGTDVVSVRVPVDNPGVFVTADMPNTSPASAVLNVDSSVTPAWAAGDVVMVANCSRAEVFYATAAAVSGATTNLSHAQVAASYPTSPGNATASLFGPYQTGAQVSRIATISYFIRNSANNTGPALWQRVANNSPVELAEGIENLQIQYGIDTDQDFDPDTWLTANNVTAANWNNLIAIRIALLVSNTDASQSRAAITDTRTFNLLGTSYGPFADQRLRRVYTSTITLRNRAR